ncbi:hypothetical protein DPMN_081321 [Dreissena polymorpha]|uniref:Uncharacterized protein n=1 Tax=Dreissena polymorpha TaxID=45954 RepID=A0A9D3Y656_DREPO|nr:hypothetical protein DPMN_081321 [Dreissena polymorpha]
MNTKCHIGGKSPRIEAFPDIGHHRAKIEDGIVTSNDKRSVNRLEISGREIQLRKKLSQSYDRQHKDKYNNKNKPIVKSNIKLPDINEKKYPWIRTKNPRGKNTAVLTHTKFVSVTEMYRISFPCVTGCANCAFDKCFGPVKVYFSEYDTPRPLFVREICDGKGRRMIPRARRNELRGLIYNQETHSLYPPVPRALRGCSLDLAKTRRMFY